MNIYMYTSIQTYDLFHGEREDLIAMIIILLSIIPLPLHKSILKHSNTAYEKLYSILIAEWF